METLKQLGREAGLRLTPQRLEILLLLTEDRGHPSAEDLHERLRQRMPSLSLDTVYRTLATFERLGIVTKLQLTGDRARFDTHIPPHHHLVCTSCGRIEDVAWSRFEELPLPEQAAAWGRVTERRVQFRGLCRRCLEGETQRPRPEPVACDHA